MSILDPELKINKAGSDGKPSNSLTAEPTDELSPWQPSADEKLIREDVIKKFALGYTTMYTPRVEFNDLSTIGRDQTDFLAFNTYQPNNGDSAAGDVINGWRSNAIRPIERNKAISIAAHAVARQLYPKIFATNQGSDPEEDAATVIRSMMEFLGEKYNYSYSALQAVIQALISPASIMHKEYIETYRKVKRDKNDNGTYNTETILDETHSGFIDTVVNTDQLYIENFFEPDIQKQAWLIWRRILPHNTTQLKFGHLPNYKYVKAGMQTLYNDANQGFYWVYDPNMRNYMDEEILYYEKERDLFLIFVNGVLLTSYDNANPRQDKLYPFVKFGYEFIRPASCFYYKSLVFKVSHDANIINTLYPMIMDGSYLNMNPPMFSTGGEMINSDVIVPSKVTTLSDPASTLSPIKIATDLKSGFDAMFKVEESINQTSEVPITQENQGPQTAFEIAKKEQERNTQLGLFLTMIASFVEQYGRLQVGDILQHLTVADADKISQNPELVYKTFIMSSKDAGTDKSYKKISFDKEMLDPADELTESYKTLKSQGGSDSNIELYRVNPEKIRSLNYMIISSPDVLSPRSEELERQFNLEAYDRGISNPTLDQDVVTKEWLLSTNRVSQRDPDKFMAKKDPMMDPNNPMAAMMQQMGAQQPGQPQGASPAPVGGGLQKPITARKPPNPLAR